MVVAKDESYLMGVKLVMNWLRVSIFCLVVSAPIGLAQDTVPASEYDNDRESFVIMASGDPLPDTDAIVVIYRRTERYQKYDSHGDGNWYYSEDGGLTRSVFDYHSQIPPPRDDQVTLFGVLEGGIHELGLGQDQEGSDSRVHILRKGNIVYIMDEDLLHIVNMSNYVIASIDYNNGIYCSPGSKRVAEHSSQYLEECFDLYDLEGTVDVQFREIKEPERFKLGITQILNANSDTYDSAIQPEFEVHADWREGPTGKQWVKLEDGADPGPYILMGIALFKRQLLNDYTTGEIVNVSEGEAPSSRTVLSVLSSALASDLGINVHLVSSDYIARESLAWNLSNIYMKEEKH